MARATVVLAMVLMLPALGAAQDSSEQLLQRYVEVAHRIEKDCKRHSRSSWCHERNAKTLERGLRAAQTLSVNHRHSTALWFSVGLNVLLSAVLAMFVWRKS